MPKLRFLLILVLATLLDLGAGLPIEASEEFQEAAHGRRRVVRLARQPDPPSTGAARARTVVRRPHPDWDVARARSSATRVRKTPEPPPDSASSTEDH